MEPVRGKAQHLGLSAQITNRNEEDLPSYHGAGREAASVLRADRYDLRSGDHGTAKGYDSVFGARPLGRVVQKDVRDPLTDEILFGPLEDAGR